MGAPSPLHEMRREMLGGAAALAGFYTVVPLAANEYPDVVRLHSQRPALFVGDAKATESPTCEATRGRLCRYFRTTRGLLAAGFEVTVAIGHATTDGNAWAVMLTNAARDAGCRVGPASIVEIDATNGLTWVDARSGQASTM